MVYETERNYTMKGKKMETESRNEIGKISLWAAIGGVVGPGALALLFILLDALTAASMSISLCVLLFVGLEVVALVTGIVGWSSPYGKAGLGASIILLAMTTLFVPVFRQASTDPAAGVEPGMAIEHTQSASAGQ